MRLKLKRRLNLVLSLGGILLLPGLSVAPAAAAESNTHNAYSGAGGVSPAPVSDLKASTRGDWTKNSWTSPTADGPVTGYQWRIKSPGYAFTSWKSTTDTANCKAWSAGKSEKVSPWGARECDTNKTPRVVLLNQGKGNTWVIQIRAVSGNSKGESASTTYVS